MVRNALARPTNGRFILSGDANANMKLNKYSASGIIQSKGAEIMSVVINRVTDESSADGKKARAKQNNQLYVDSVFSASFSRASAGCL